MTVRFAAIVLTTKDLAAAEVCVRNGSDVTRQKSPDVPTWPKNAAWNPENEPSGPPPRK